MSLLSNISFAIPYALFALLILPAVWFLLKVFPPSPSKLMFPATRFLENIITKEETPSSAPLWLLFLRIIIFILIILSIANPQLNRAPPLADNGHVVIIVDDGWSSASNWEQTRETMFSLIDRADIENRSISIITTAESHLKYNNEILNANKARQIAKKMTPKPWPSKREAILELLSSSKIIEKANVFWINDGIEHDSPEITQRFVTLIGQKSIRLEIIKPKHDKTPKILLPPLFSPGLVKITVKRSVALNEENIIIKILGRDSKLITSKSLQFSSDKREGIIEINLPNEIQSQITRIEIDEHTNVGSIFLVDTSWYRRKVGIVADKNIFQTSPLLSPAYYLNKAMSPFSDVIVGDLNFILNENLSVIMLTDTGNLKSEDKDRLTLWIQNGGVLVRFAGPKLIQNPDDLLPVKLRISGTRSMGGLLSWEKPAKLGNFSEDGPFKGLKIPDDISINSQLVAEPSQTLGKAIWAQLEDGTPLVTSLNDKKGWLILFHVTANNNWSNLPLSGLFVDMLQRIVEMSKGINEDIKEIPLPPLIILDGYGKAGKPPSNILPISSSKAKASTISPDHPPGFYGNTLLRKALNITESIQQIVPISSNFPKKTIFTQNLGKTLYSFKPWILTLALILVLIDTMISLIFRGYINIKRIFSNKYANSFFIILCFFSFDAFSEDIPPAAIDSRLAYIITGDSKLDQISRIGLTKLTNLLKERTSIELATPDGIRLSENNMGFYPLIYWPISSLQPNLKNQAIDRLKNYISSGGLIILDTRNNSPIDLIDSDKMKSNKLINLLRPLDLPPLIQIPKDHVLSRSFYLLDSFPGRWDGGNLWVESTASNSRDGVSSVIIGGNDWAAAWAMDENGLPLYQVVPGGEKQREFAFRFGINATMYAMTGNYKADQVHSSSILQRLIYKEQSNQKDTN